MPANVACHFITPVSHRGSRNIARSPLGMHAKVTKLFCHCLMGFSTAKARSNKLLYRARRVASQCRVRRAGRSAATTPSWFDNRLHKIVVKRSQRSLQSEDRHLQAFRKRRFEDYNKHPVSGESREGSKAAGISFLFKLPPGFAQMGEEEA